MTEGEFKKQVLDLLQKSGIWFLRCQSGVIKKGARYIHLMPAGTPDYLLLLPSGRIAWLEIKGLGQQTAKDRREKQQAFRTRALNHNFYHCQADTLEQVSNYVAALLEDAK